MLRIVLLAVMAAAAAGAAELPAKPLPGNKPCAYPPEARKALVAGPVRVVVDVRPDGTAESVDVVQVPLPRLGFDSSVRDCLMTWRFEPAPNGQTGLRRYEGRFLFRMFAAEESALRELIVALAQAWNAGFVRSLMVRLAGDAIAETDERGRRIVDETFLMLLNASDGDIMFHLPGPAPDMIWERTLYTAETEWARPSLLRTKRYRLAGRSFAVLRMRPRPTPASAERKPPPVAPGV